MTENIADKLKIEKLFESDLSSYKIAQVAEMNRMTVWKMRTGESDIEKVEFGNAIRLTEVYDELKKEGTI